MNIAIFNETVSCKFWELTDGTVFEDRFSLDTETCLIDQERPWLIPAFVVAAVYDGQRAFFLTRKTLADFLHLHRHLPIIMHNAVFDLKVMDVLLRETSLDIYELVDHNLISDTQILFRLLRLATTGNSSLDGTGLDVLSHRFLGATMKKDVTDIDDATIRLNFGRYIREPEIGRAHV